MKFNGKKFCLLFTNSIRVEENIIHWHGYLNKEDHKKRINRYWDNDSYMTILYRDGDELLSVSRNRRKWGLVGMLSIDKGLPSPRRKVPINMSKEYAERYKNDPKLKNTMVHHEALNKSKINKMITVDDVPDCHLLIPFNQISRIEWPEEFYSQDWNRYRNIVPYKSNLVDSARNFLDLFGGHKAGVFHSTFEGGVFDTDKKTLWKYLDEHIFTGFESVPEKLKQYGIEFEYFDLDKDSYKKTFEIDEDPLFRLGGYNLMGQLKNFPTKQTRDRYHRLTDIAKEYVAQCGREDNRITL